MRTRVAFGPQGYIGVFVIAAFLGSVFFANSDLEEMHASSPKRQVGIKKGSFYPTSQPYKYSPFIIDQIVPSGKSEFTLFENSSDETLRMQGPATEVFRLFMSGQGVFEVNFKLRKKDAIPKIWLYNDRNQLVSVGEWSGDSTGQGVSTHQIQKPGLYKLKMVFDYGHVQSISLNTTIIRKQLLLSDYVRKNIKTINIYLQPEQYKRMRELKNLQEQHWKGLSLKYSEQYFPSPKDGVLGYIRVSRGSWAVAAFELAGRNSQHKTEYLFPSTDVKIIGGELPFGLERFKLYPIKAKDYGLDMLMESLLEDVGLFIPRQDIAQVLLDGKFVGYYQIMEGNRPHFFEYGQTPESPVIGFDPNFLIGKKGISHFVPRSFFKKKRYPVEKQPDPGTYEFSRNICLNDYALANSFALTYSGNHGVGASDTRFNLNAQKNCYQPIVKDFNAGILAINFGNAPTRSFLPFFNGLRALGTLAPEWRPNVATYSSYFVFRGKEKNEADDFFWWNALPSTLYWFSGKENFSDFLRHFARWDAPWSRNRVGQRLKNLERTGQVIEAANDNKMGLETKLNYPLIQDILPTKNFQRPLKIRNQLEGYPDLLYIRKAISQLTHRSVHIDNHSLAMYKWRNQESESLISMMRKSEKIDKKMFQTIDQDEKSTMITFFFRKDHPQSISMIFLERNSEGESNADPLLILKDSQGRTYSPKNSLSVGNKIIPIKTSDLYINNVRVNEKVRFHWFEIPKTDGYQYVQPEGLNQAIYFGPHEITILPKEPELIRNELPLPLEQYMTRSGNTLSWKKDAPHPMGPIVIPKDHEWIVKEPLSIKFGPKGCLEIRGKLSILSAGKLHLTSLNDSWSGMHFLENEDLALERLSVENIGSGEDHVICNGRSYTGAVSFFDTRIALKNSKIRNIRAEDALHFFHSEVHLDDLKIDTTQSDAIDGDFSYMKINAITLREAGILGTEGGDGLDVSGSLVMLDKSKLSNNVDKNLSIGENSRVFVDSSFFENGGYGIAVKDGSYLEISNSGFSKNQKDIDAYVKKPYFPFPEIVTKENLTFNSPSM